MLRRWSEHWLCYTCIRRPHLSEATSTRTRTSAGGSRTPRRYPPGSFAVPKDAILLCFTDSDEEEEAKGTPRRTSSQSSSLIAVFGDEHLPCVPDETLAGLPRSSDAPSTEVVLCGGLLSCVTGHDEEERSATLLPGDPRGDFHSKGHAMRKSHRQEGQRGQGQMRLRFLRAVPSRSGRTK